MSDNHDCDPEFHLPPDPELVPWTKEELEEQFKRVEAGTKDEPEQPIGPLPF